MEFIMFEKLFLKNSIYAKVQLLGRPPVHSSLFEQLLGEPACICMCREVQASGQCGELFLGVIHLSCWDLPTWLSWGASKLQGLPVFASQCRNHEQEPVHSASPCVLGIELRSSCLNGKHFPD